MNSTASSPPSMAVSPVHSMLNGLLDKRQLGVPGQVGEERFLELVDQFANSVRQIDERFNDRLSGKVIRFGEDYINNSFGIVIRLHRRGEREGEWIALCVDACKSKVDTAAIGADEFKAIFKSYQMSDSQQEPVLVDFVELIKTPNERRVIIPSFARVYNIKNERLGLWEGLIYRQIRLSGVIDTVREILPFFASWKGSTVRAYAFRGSRERGPKIVRNCVEVMDCVPQVEWNGDGKMLLGANEDTSWIRIVIDSDNIRVIGDDLFYEMFDAADVLLGPFNLEF
jgi:hypothetical protein